jgi:hypothetical protein
MGLTNLGALQVSRKKLLKDGLLNEANEVRGAAHWSPLASSLHVELARLRSFYCTRVLVASLV